MRLFINIVTVIGIILAAASVAYLIYAQASGASENGGIMSVLMSQLWATIGAVIALVFGFIGRVMDRSKVLPTARISLIGIATGLIGGLLVLAFPLL